MFEKGRQKMIAGINDVAGRTDCTEAVLLQQRSAKHTLPLLVGFVALIAAIEQTIDPGTIVTAALIGLIASGGITFVTSTFWLGRCGDVVVMATVNKWQTKALHLVAEYDYPMPATIDTGRISHKVTMDGETYILTRQMLNGFRRVTGSPG